MRYLVVDLEATCDDGPHFSRENMEIIEIGAVRLDEELQPADEFMSFVHPVLFPQLSTFCKRLTSIKQSDVDDADPFPLVFERFLDWIGDSEHRFCSWGEYDKTQFARDCQRHEVPMPSWFAATHFNVKRHFAAQHDGQSRWGMSEALARIGLEMEGTLHRGIDDARNIARIAQTLLRGQQPFSTVPR